MLGAMVWAVVIERRVHDPEVFHGFKADQTFHPSGINKNDISIGWELKVLVVAALTVAGSLGCRMRRL
jgi:hypothetical protein